MTTPDATGTHAHYYLTQPEEPRGCLVLCDDTGSIQYLFSDGSVLEVHADEPPVAVTGDPARPQEWQTFVTVQKQWQTWRYDLERRGWTGTIDVTLPRENVRLIATSDWDHPDAMVGDEEDHGYINVAKGPDGYYVTVSLDCNSANFGDTLCEDDGPYESYDAALAAGKSVAAEWCSDNDVYDEDERLSEVGVGSQIWVKPHRRAMDQAVRATVLSWEPGERVAALRYDDGRVEDYVSFDLIRGIDYDAD